MSTIGDYYSRIDRESAKASAQLQACRAILAEAEGQIEALDPHTPCPNGVDLAPNCAYTLKGSCLRCGRRMDRPQILHRIRYEAERAVRDAEQARIDAGNTGD